SFVAIACTKTEAPATDTSAAAAPAAAPINHDADAVTIRQADSAWMRHLVAKHVDSLMTWYAPDAVSYGFGAPATGSDQIKNLYTEMTKSTVSNRKILSNTVKFSDDGSMAFDHGTYTMTMTAPGGKPETSTGAYLNVW